MPKLNIIFHGTFVFSLNKDKKRFEVNVPELPGHVYLGGNWLGELELPPKNGEKEAVLELRGVVPADDIVDGTNTLDESRNLVVLRGAPTSDALPLRAIIVLPLPSRVTTPATVDMDRKRDIGEGTGQLKNQQFKVGALQIFTYDKANVDPDDQLRVIGIGGADGLTWEPEVENSVVNLHFFAAHPHHRMSGGTVHQHVKVAFDECMKRSGSAIRMKPVILNGSVLDGPLPDGVLLEETEGLESRIRRMAQLGRMRKAERDLNLLWFDSESLDAQPDACTGSGNC